MEQELLEIKKSIIKECVSEGEIAYLESHKQAVLNTGDILLCQWAGITEEEYNKGRLNPDLHYEEDFIELDIEDDQEGNAHCTIRIDDGQELVITEHELRGLIRILQDNHKDIEDYFEQLNQKYRNE